MYLQELTVLNLRHLIWMVCLFWASFSFGQKEDWQPVTSQDQQIKEVPGNAGADAIQLYYADYINDNDHSEFYPTMKSGTVELSMENVPAFQGENNMPPEENYKPQVR